MTDVTRINYAAAILVASPCRRRNAHDWHYYAYRPRMVRYVCPGIDAGVVSGA